MRNKINNKNELILLAVVVLQIFLLINGVAARSYMIHESEGEIEDSKVENKNILGDLIGKGINLLIGFLSIKQIGTVSAACCLDTCQDVEFSSECSGNSAPADCDETGSCVRGTCVDEENGICSAGSPKSFCEDDEGVWYSDSLNDVSDCKLGCCTLNNGASKQFMRKIKCLNDEGTFNPSVSEAECRIYTNDMGACVSDEGNCKFTTEKDCETNLVGDFHRGILCTSSGLETNCERPASQGEIITICHDDKVYFTDSCGNLANIYDSSRWNNENYWNTAQEPTCTGTVGSRNCGNCDISESICASSSDAGINPTYGDNVCKDLKCKDENGKIRQNGESWCVYDSYVGDGKDVVGSEHRLRWCDKGTVKTELCENMRGQLCAEKIIGEISYARCRINEGWKCYELEAVAYDFDEDDFSITNQVAIDEYKAKCEALSDCKIQSVDLYDNDDEDEPDLLKFDACVPKYPPGLEFWDSGSNAEDMCDVATIECTTVWRKIAWFDWRCKGNCNCLSQDFANQMNDFCISLGDCGGYVNIEGKYTKGYSAYDYNLNEDKYKKKSNYDANGYISDSKVNDYKSYASDSQEGKGDLPDFFSSSEQGVWGGDPFTMQDLDEENFIENVNIVVSVLSSTFGIGGTITSILISKGIIAGKIGLAFGIVGIAISAIIVLFLIIFRFLTKTKEISVEFECQPWQAPLGGDDCSKCNNDPARPCTQYKCKSLGSACELISEGELYETENPVCINAYSGDVNPPKIVFESIGDDYIIEGETNNGFSIRNSEGGCIQELSILNFTLKTENENGEDDYAKCVYALNRATDPPSPGNDYSLNGENFVEGNLFSVTHSFDGALPLVSSLNDIRGNLGAREGDLNMYVRCADYAGNFNVNEYVVNTCIKEGPDLTPPNIVEYTPEDGSYLKYNQTSQLLTITLNEPAECKWTHDTDKSYDDMENEFICEEYIPNVIQSRWDCWTELTDLTDSENNIYIKCKDQPWIPDEEYDGIYTEENRNANSQGFLYTLSATQNNLEITSISPSGEIEVGGEDNQINLETTTSGGVDNGIAVCEYRFIESPSGTNVWDIFFETNAKSHRQPFTLQSGDYNILVTCKDEIGNIAEESTSLNIIRDEDAPLMVRIYNEGGKLKLITNEPAKCYYDTHTCSFDIIDKENTDYDMTTGYYTTEHSAKWDPSITYHIKCEDSFGNVNSGCMGRITPSS